MTVRAVWNGVVLAESDDIVTVEGNDYFPEESLRSEHLLPSDRRTVCPWKGVASYRSVRVRGEVNRDAVWHYEHPSPLARRIKGRAAFGRDVEVVEVEPSERDG